MWIKLSTFLSTLKPDQSIYISKNLVSKNPLDTLPIKISRNSEGDCFFWEKNEAFKGAAHISVQLKSKEGKFEDLKTVCAIYPGQVIKLEDIEIHLPYFLTEDQFKHIKYPCKEFTDLSENHAIAAGGAENCIEFQSPFGEIAAITQTGVNVSYEWLDGKTYRFSRDSNEDAYGIFKAPDKSIFAIAADGMGGYEKGEIASRQTILAVKELVEKGKS